MITTLAFISWLQELAPSLRIYEKHAAPLPDKPDRLVMVTRAPGAGETMDGLFDQPSFTARVRGTAHDPTTAESDAILLDSLVRGAALPALFGDTWVTSIIRFGGLGPLPGTPDSGHRTEWLVTWIVTGSTNM